MANVGQVTFEGIASLVEPSSVLEMHYVYFTWYRRVIELYIFILTKLTKLYL